MKLTDREYTPAPIDGTSTWQTLPASANYEVQGNFVMQSCNIIIGDTSYLVHITTDDKTLTEETVNYHETNNRFLPPATCEAEKPLEVFYASRQDVDIDEIKLQAGSNPYVAAMSVDGSRVVATGKVSVGTLKSICFGAVSSLACRASDYVPLHASIGHSDGKNAFAVSGRGNWGKTTNMIGAKVRDPEITVVTDDWSLINVSSREIVPIDMLVAIRPEAVPGIIAAIEPETPPIYLTTAQKDSGTLFSVYDIFGNSRMAEKLQLQRLLLTDKRIEMDLAAGVYDTNGLDEAWRLKDDAYHSPDLHGEYEAKYKRLAKDLEISAICTTLPNDLRPLQLANIISFFRGK